jgi:hypothetical protein
MNSPDSGKIEPKLCGFESCITVKQPSDDYEWIMEEADKDYWEQDVLNLCNIFAALAISTPLVDLERLADDKTINRLTSSKLGEIAFLCSRFKRPSLFQLKHMIQKREFEEFKVNFEYRDVIDKYANQYCENVAQLKNLVENGEIVEAFRKSVQMVCDSKDLFLPYICREPTRYSEYARLTPEEFEAVGVEFSTISKTFSWSYRLALYMIHREFMIALDDEEVSRKLMKTEKDANANGFNPLREVDGDVLHQIELKSLISDEKKERFMKRELINLQFHLETGMIPKWKNGDFDERTVQVWERQSKS